MKDDLIVGVSVLRCTRVVAGAVVLDPAQFSKSSKTKLYASALVA